MLQELTHSELLVMKAVWDIDKETSLSEILAHVNAEFQKEWKPQTVSTFLTKLVRKNYLILKRKGRDWVYEILVTAEEYQKQEMTNLLMFWGGNSVGSVISALCKDRQIKDEEREEIRRLLDELDNDTIL